MFFEILFEGNSRAAAASRKSTLTAPCARFAHPAQCCRRDGSASKITDARENVARYVAKQDGAKNKRARHCRALYDNHF
jgi:hypothetical protein